MSEIKKIYVGRAKYRDTKFGELLRIWLTPEGVEAINHNVDNNGGINLEMHELRTPDRGGFTHYIIVDDYKPADTARKGASEGSRRHGRSDRREERDRDERRVSGERTPDRRRDDDGGFDEYAEKDGRSPVDPSYGPDTPPASNEIFEDEIPF